MFRERPPDGLSSPRRCGLERALGGGCGPAGRPQHSLPSVGAPPASSLGLALGGGPSPAGPSGQIWAAERNPVISSAPASSVPSGGLFAHFPLLAAGGRRFLKAAAARSGLLAWVARFLGWHAAPCSCLSFPPQTREGRRSWIPSSAPACPGSRGMPRGAGVPEARRAPAPPVFRLPQGRGGQRAGSRSAWHRRGRRKALRGAGAALPSWGLLGLGAHETAGQGGISPRGRWDLASPSAAHVTFLSPSLPRASTQTCPRCPRTSAGGARAAAPSPP